ncbi:MAG: polyphosphate--nucleotide phosphotransferase [Burkholderiaceae bacterium]
MSRTEPTSLPYPASAVLASPDDPWSRWQVPALEPATASRKAAFRLAAADPQARPVGSGSKGADVEALEKLALELDALQDMFWADRRFKLLLVLQGMDTSGKDGTVRSVFARTSPLGVHTVGWKAPTEVEREHDFLWRIHQRAPGAGEIMIFNRSHYEDVLVPVVNGWITKEQTRQRYEHINDFERLLAQTGTVVVKCMLHISHREQQERLQARIDNPRKNWKFDHNDLSVRNQWDDYQKAYDDLLNATSTPWAPWNVVPSDSKSHRNLMVGQLVHKALHSLQLRYPPADPSLKDLKVTD